MNNNTVHYEDALMVKAAWYYYFENMTLEQIADREGCTKQAVKDTLRTAEKFLSKILKNFQ